MTSIYISGSKQEATSGFGVVILAKSHEKITAHGQVPLPTDIDGSILYAMYVALSLVSEDVTVHTDSQRLVSFFQMANIDNSINRQIMDGINYKLGQRRVAIEYAQMNDPYLEEANNLAIDGRTAVVGLIINRTPLVQKIIAPTMEIVHPGNYNLVLDSAIACRNLCNEFGVPADSVVRKLMDPTVRAARDSNVVNRRRGSVYLGKVWRAQKSEDIPVIPGAVSIYISKGKGHLGGALSPFNVFVPRRFVLGTINGNRGGPSLWSPPGVLLELWWQATKIARSEIANNGTITDSYWNRRARIYQDQVAKRKYIDTDQIAGAIFGNKGDPIYQYIESRVFYCEAYEEILRSPSSGDTHRAFLFLKRLVDQGVNVLLLGPDAHPLPTAVTVKQSYEIAYLNKTEQFGHERVLAAMLSLPNPPDLPWKSYRLSF